MARTGGPQHVVDHCPADSGLDWPAVFAEHRAVAQRSLRAVLGHCPEEEDLLQDVAVRLVIRLRESGELCSVGDWTWRVAHNVAVDHIRKHRATPTEDRRLDRAVGDGLDGGVIAAELAATLSAGLSRLPPRQRDALLAQASLDGGRGSHGLVAHSLGVSPKAAESLLARARRSLLDEIRQPGLDALAAPIGVLAALRRLLRRKATIVAVAAAAVITVSADMAPIPVSPAQPGPRAAMRTPSTAAVSPRARGETPPGGPASTGTDGRPVHPRAAATGPDASPAPVAPPTVVGVSATLPPLVSPSSLPAIPTVTIPAVTVPGVAIPPVPPVSSVVSGVTKLVTSALPPLAPPAPPLGL